MGGAWLNYDVASGFWTDVHGARFIKNEFDPTCPIFLSVTDRAWKGSYLEKSCTLPWPETLDRDLCRLLKSVLKQRMRHQAPSALERYRQVIGAMARFSVNGRRFQSADVRDGETIRKLWDTLNSDLRSVFRELVPDLIALDDPLAAYTMSLLLKDWKAKRPLKWKQSVLEWDPREGSLTSAELEVLRAHLTPPSSEALSDHFARLVIRLTLTTLRRPSQLISIRADGLRRITTGVGTTVDVRVPTGKAQKGMLASWLPIPADLADDIEAYRTRPEFRNVPLTQEVLLPIALREGDRRGDVSNGDEILRVIAPNGTQAKAAAQAWVADQKIISPRTGKPLHLNLRRLRHTGATHMAMQGYPLDLIQDVLEHASENSTRYYIDAVGIEFLPVFEKADRNLGGRFSMMKDAWFSGRVVDRPEASHEPIIVPDVKAPAVVGACGKGGACPVHPLFSCYSCQHFLAFRDANHKKVLDFVEAEYARWRAVESSNSRSKAIKDFDRIAASVREVMTLIEQDFSDGIH
jgi:integrase